MQVTNRSGEAGSIADHVTPDLSYGLEGERKRRAKIINGMEKVEKKKDRSVRLALTHFRSVCCRYCVLCLYKNRLEQRAVAANSERIVSCGDI